MTTQIVSFFARCTILDIIPLLTDDQLDETAKRHLKLTKKSVNSLKSKTAKIDFVTTRANKFEDQAQAYIDYEDLQSAYKTLTAEINSARSETQKPIKIDISEDMKQLTQSLEKISAVNLELTDKLQKLSTQINAVPENIKLKDSDTTENCTLDPPINGKTINFDPSVIQEALESLERDNLPFLVIKNTPFQPLDYGELNNSMDYTHTLRNRKVAYHGEYPYEYGGIKHNARPIAENENLEIVATQFREHFPAVKFNSITANHYENGQQGLGFHCDDEAMIEKNSIISSISLGGTRKLTMRRITGTYDKTEVILEHGDIMLMTRKSQDDFDHAILPDPSCQEPRLNFTLRDIININSIPKSHDIINELTKKVQKPKRVLILSDSRGQTFDTSNFREPIVCVKKQMYHLSKLPDFSNHISAADIVLISCGINDIVRGGARARSLCEYLHKFVDTARQRYPNTMFLFGSVECVQGRYNTNYYNDEIDTLNSMLFDLALQSANFKLFDNMEFRENHLARDGLHLSPGGKASLAKSWVNAVLVALDFRKTALPIRKSFRMRYERRYLASAPR